MLLPFPLMLFILMEFDFPKYCCEGRRYPVFFTIDVLHFKIICALFGSCLVGNYIICMFQSKIFCPTPVIHYVLNSSKFCQEITAVN